MPAIPLALAGIGAAVGVPLAAPAIVGIAAGAAVVGGLGYMGYSAVSNANKDVKSANSDAQNAQVANQAAIKEVQDAQGAASAQAQASIERKRTAMTRSRTIYTNPLGIADQANTAKKTLLGE